MDQLRRRPHRKPAKRPETLATVLRQYRRCTQVLECLASLNEAPSYGNLHTRLFAQALRARLTPYCARLDRLIADPPRLSARIYPAPEKHPYAKLSQAVDAFRRNARPRGSLHRTLTWAQEHIDALRDGLDDRRSTGLFSGEPPEDVLQYQGHPQGPVYADAQTLVWFLPFTVATVETASKDSPLALYAEHLHEQAWDILLDVAPLGLECAFDLPLVRLRRPSTAGEAWRRLWDATTIAQAQASPDGATAALIEDAQVQLRILGDGIGEPDGGAWSKQ